MATFQIFTNFASPTTLATGETEIGTPVAKPGAKLVWLKSFVEQSLAVRAALKAFGAPTAASVLAKTFAKL